MRYIRAWSIKALIDPENNQLNVVTPYKLFGEIYAERRNLSTCIFFRSNSIRRVIRFNIQLIVF